MDNQSSDAGADSGDTRNSDAVVITSLQSELELLRKKIKELETENARLSSMVLNCCCQKTEEDNGVNVVDEISSVEIEEGLKLESENKKKKKCKDRVSGYNTRILREHSKRYVALKVMYFGQRFYGFASEAQMDPTVESEIFKALIKTSLVFGEKKSVQYSRCGRTDKGVSSVGQVIALFLRSNHKETAISTEYSGETCPEEKYESEIDYVRILNKVLPNDICVMGWSPAPIDFNARFSCLSREYKYFFWRENLNIAAMEIAGKKFIGEHDFRHFCKMDAANVHNYRRFITSFEIFPCNERLDDDQIWVIKIRGSAFLWHQVRCMVAVLFLIGKGLESPDVIDALLDLERTPRKPQYKMAPEIPLVLQSCEFEGLKFMCSMDAKQALHAHLQKECRVYKLQAAIFNEALLSCSLTETDNMLLNNRMRKKEPCHVPLLLRPTEPSYEERRWKLDSGSEAQR